MSYLFTTILENQVLYKGFGYRKIFTIVPSDAAPLSNDVVAAGVFFNHVIKVSYSVGQRFIYGFSPIHCGMNMFKAVKMRFDPEKNAIIIDVGDMPSTVTEVEVPFHALKQALPKEMTEDEQIKELQRMIHKIEREKLAHIAEVIKEFKRLSKGIENARKKLANAGTKNEIARERHVVQSWVAQKNIVKELRLAIKALNDEKKELRVRVARLETGT